jgi:hypothetical protein
MVGKDYLLFSARSFKNCREKTAGKGETFRPQAALYDTQSVLKAVLCIIGSRCIRTHTECVEMLDED